MHGSELSWQHIKVRSKPVSARITAMALISLQRLQKSVMSLVIITVVVCFMYSRMTTDTDIHCLGTHWRRNISRQPKTFQGNEGDNNTARTRKFIIAFHYWEQLTRATDDLLHLTALAAHTGHQVVVPFVKNSRFHVAAVSKGFKTLAQYFNVTALNNTLRSRGHATFISWKGFQDACKRRLDVLVCFDYTNLNKSTTYSVSKSFALCKHNQPNKFRDFKIGRKICMNVFALDSVERFESEVVKGLPCIGIFEWRGSNTTKNYRAQFNLSSIVRNVLSYNDTGGFFNSKLLHVAQNFVAQNLVADFISVHIRTEKILQSGRTPSLIKHCVSRLRSRVETILHASTVPMPVFVATDFTEFGSSSRRMKPARDDAKSLMKIVDPLKPITFEPSEYELVDRGAVAIVEMNIIASGKHLVVLGRGSFQLWVITQFLNKNSGHPAKVERIACREMQSAGI